MIQQKFRKLKIDIENAPNLAYVWGKYEQDVISFVKERYLISIAWKWEDEKDVKVLSIRTVSVRQLVKKLHSLFEEAGVVVGHNGDGFDIKMANAFFIKFGLKPTHHFTTIDTLKIARNRFKFNSNKLDDLGEYLGLGRKIRTDKYLWLDCIKKNKQALLKMEKYNKQDVVLLDKVEKKLLPWVKNIPITYQEAGRCQVCGGKHFQSRGKQIVLGGFKKRFSCQTCGKWKYGKKETLTINN